MKPGSHGLATEINLSNTLRREIDHLRILSHGKKSARDMATASATGFRRTHRHNVAVMRFYKKMLARADQRNLAEAFLIPRIWIHEAGACVGHKLAANLPGRDAEQEYAGGSDS